MWRWLFVPSLFSGLHFLWVVLGSFQAPFHYFSPFVAKLCGYKKKSVKSSSGNKSALLALKSLESGQDNLPELYVLEKKHWTSKQTKARIGKIMREVYVFLGPFCYLQEESSVGQLCLVFFWDRLTGYQLPLLQLFLFTQLVHLLHTNCVFPWHHLAQKKLNWFSSPKLRPT